LMEVEDDSSLVTRASASAAPLSNDLETWRSLRSHGR
jgi:hypothetical protein